MITESDTTLKNQKGIGVAGTDEKVNQLNQNIVPPNAESIEKAPNYINFEWITNEGLLRDEGVICGLAGVDTEHKINAIDAYYDEQLTKQDNLKKQIELKLEDLHKKLGKLQSKIDQNITVSNELAIELQQQPYVLLLRISVFLIVSLLICTFQLLFIYSLLKSVVTSPLIMSLALFSAGMFGQHTFQSFLFSNEVQSEDVDHEKWKRIFIEFSLPLISSLLLCAILSQGNINVLLIAYFFYFLFVFMFNGKMFLSNVGLIQRNIAKYQENRRNKNKINEILDYKISENNEFEEKKLILETEILNSINELNNINKTNNFQLLKKLSKEIFLSEYHLAKDYRNSNQKGKQIVA